MSAAFRVDLSGQSVQFRFQNVSFDGIRTIVSAEVSQDINARAAKASNLSDLSDRAAATGNLLFGSRSVSTKLTDTLSTADRGVSTAGTAAANTTAINNLVAEVHGDTGFLEVSEGTYSVTQVVLPPAGDYRGDPFVFLGRGTGEPYVQDALQGGTLLSGTSATQATVKINRAGAAQGAGSIEFGQLRVSGAQNSGVPALQIDGLIGLNNLHDFSVNQTGVGDGIHAGWLGGSIIDRFVTLGPYWNGAGSPSGTGFVWEPDWDIGLGELSHGTMRGFALGWQIGQTAPGASNDQRLLASTARLCEVSYCTDGFLLNAQVEGFNLDQPYIEGATGTAVEDNARATCISVPYIALAFTKGIDFQGRGGVVLGGVLGLATTGSTGIVIGAGGSGARSVFGTQLIWGGGSAGTNVGYGIQIEAQADPRVNLFPDFVGDWTGVSGSARLLDQSYSSDHGGSGSALGSGAIGWLERRTQGDQPLPCLSRGAINLKVDTSDLNTAYIDGSNVLTVSASSVQYLTLSSAKTVGRIKSPTLPDKTGWLLIDSGNVTFSPSASYMGGLTVPEIFGPGEIGVVSYQTVPGVNGKVWITGVYRQKPHAYTVATLPSAATAGAGFRAFVTDASAPTFGSTVAGGGAVATPVYSDGTDWKVG